MDYFISVSPMGGYFNENITYTSLITKTKLKKNQIPCTEEIWQTVWETGRL